MEPTQHTPKSRFVSTLGSMGTPARRAPGTPLSTRRALDRPSHRPSTISHSTGNTIGSPNNIFRASMSGERARNTFTPRASSTLRHTFSPLPHSLRASTTSRPLASSSAPKPPRSSQLFTMTIDDPPASLDGEALMKRVPDDATRQGSIYADEFLQNTCPPGLDDLGRRQWFCVLDLRRLKYAANELFAKKDWKLNVTNFAKEYEKSRGLIMLRYGLYEFQTVKPTDDQLRKWRREHEIPDPEDEDTPLRRSHASSSKRKAEDDLPLGASSANKSKRRQTEPEAPSAAKQAAVQDDDDENRSSKPPKATTPSQSLSAFMKAAAGSATSQPTPSKPASSGVVSTKSAPQSIKSVFDDPKAANVPSPNPFEHLSDASRAASVNNDEESDPDSEADGNDDKDASTPSGGVGTPADGQEGTPSLFDRVTKDKNGQPVRLTGTNGDSDKAGISSFAPANQTWSASTPIKFSGGSSTAFGSKPSDEVKEPAPFKPMFAPKKSDESKPAPVPTQSQPTESAVNAPFGAAPAKTPPAEAKQPPPAGPLSTQQPLPALTSAPAPVASLFGSIKKSAESADAPKPAVANLFALTTSSQPPTSSFTGPSSQANGTIKAPETAPAANSSVLASSTLFGPKPSDTNEPPKALAPSSPTTSIMPTSSASTGEVSKSVFGSSAIPSGGTFFGVTPTADAKDNKDSTVESARPAKRLFGGDSESAEPPTKKAFGLPAEGKPNGSLFGNSTPADSKPASLFGGPSQPPLTLFSGSATSSNASFGATSSEVAKPTFGFGGGVPKPSTSTGGEKPSFSFGSAAATAAPLFSGDKPESGSSVGIFRSSSQSQPGRTIFGSAAGSTSVPAPSGAAPAQNGFQFSAAAPVNNPFVSSTGGDAGPASVNFGNSSTQPSTSFAPSSFSFGADNSAPAPTGGFSFGGSSGAATPPQASNPTFSFTGATPGAGNTGNMFAPQPSGLAAPGGTSTGTSSPFNFGGASSVATTPEPTTAVNDGASNTAPDALKTTCEEGEETQSQVNLTEGGHGEEDEKVIHEVKSKALKEEMETANGDKDTGVKSKSAWSTKGVGPLRLLKHKMTGAVRVVLRAEPRGNVVINCVPISGMPYTPKGKYCIAPFLNENGGLDKWMLMVKTPDAAKALAEAINKHKSTSKQE